MKRGIDQTQKALGQGQQKPSLWLGHPQFIAYDQAKEACETGPFRPPYSNRKLRVREKKMKRVREMFLSSPTSLSELPIDKTLTLPNPHFPPRMKRKVWFGGVPARPPAV